MQSPGGERKHGTFERAKQGFEYEEVMRAVAGELSWGRAHEVLELCLVWGFRVAWRLEGPDVISFVALKDDCGCRVERGQQGQRADTVRGWRWRRCLHTEPLRATSRCAGCGRLESG